MASITVHQHPGDSPQARVLTLENGQRLVSVKFGEDITLILQGRDVSAIAAARELAHVLLDAADRIEDMLIAREKMAG